MLPSASHIDSGSLFPPSFPIREPLQLQKLACNVITSEIYAQALIYAGLIL